MGKRLGVLGRIRLSLQRTAVVAPASFLILSGLSASVHAAEHDPADTVDRNTYIVALRDTSDKGFSATVASLASEYHAEIQHTYDKSIQGFAARMSRHDATRIASNPAVRSVESDTKVRLDEVASNAAHRSEFTKSSAGYDVPWGLDRIDQRNGVLDGIYHRPDYWDHDDNGYGVDVWVIDTGVDDHNEMPYAQQPRDFVDNDYDSRDCHGHGTHVAATIAGNYMGVAPRAGIHSIRVLDCNGVGQVSDVIAGINYVKGRTNDPHEDVVFIGAFARYSSVFDVAVQELIDEGATVVVPAGNHSEYADVSSPARVADAITVAAMTPSGSRASWSNHGGLVDMYAPGLDVLSAGHTGFNHYVNRSGTTMAAAHVAGVAARYLSRYPSASPNEVEAALKNNSTKNVITNPAPYTTRNLVHASWVGQPPSSCTIILTNTNPLPIRFPAKSISTVPVSGCGTVGFKGQVRLEYSISHARMADLEIKLRAPSGKYYPLLAAGIGAPTTGVFEVLVDEPLRNGSWYFTVKDVVAANDGSINSWKLGF
ncbi:S8 family serine peptidase [Catellatospora sp. NPDC049609]|uniref:S8 family peptidase n=1 Tax=Catellatospora sp. NPDC049609 TaxID=3155505 RepID=UPI00341D377A